MAKPKSITIKLTARQRNELKKLTGESHAEVKFEKVGSVMASKTAVAKKLPTKRAIASKSAQREFGSSGVFEPSFPLKKMMEKYGLSRRQALAVKSAGRAVATSGAGPLSTKLAGRQALATKSAGRAAAAGGGPLSTKLAGRQALATKVNPVE